MPAPRVINTAREKPEPSGVQQFFSRLGKDYKDKQDRVEIGNLISQYQQNRESATAWEDLQLGLEKSNIGPTKRLETQNQLNEIRKNIIAQDKALNAKANKGILDAQEKERQKQNLIDTGYLPEEADVYLDSPPSVKNVIEKHVRSEVDRGIRKVKGKEQEVVSNQQEEKPIPIFINDNETEVVKDFKKTEPIEETWPEPELPEKMNPAERVKWENNNEKENNIELKQARDKKKGYKSNNQLIRSMQQTSPYLPKGVQKVIIDPKTGDIRPEAQLAGLVNPETQLYVKNLKQWLKGAKEFFGARVTDFDVTSFMAQLPSLMNSEQGRNLILKQMQYTNELEEIHNNTLEEALKKYGRKANYNQIVRVVDDKVAVREKDLLSKIDNVVQASQFIDKMAKNPEKFSDMIAMQNPDTGEFFAVPNEKVEKLKAKGWRDF